MFCFGAAKIQLFWILQDFFRTFRLERKTPFLLKPNAKPSVALVFGHGLHALPMAVTVFNTV